MWMLLKDCLPPAGPSLDSDMGFRPPSGTYQVVPARPPDPPITAEAITKYHDQTRTGPVTAEVKHEASWDLLAITYKEGLSSQDLTDVTAMYDKVEAGDPLTDDDLKEITAIIDRVEGRLQGAAATTAPTEVPTTPAATAAPDLLAEAKNHYQKAEALYANKDYAGAELEYRASLKIEESMPDATPEMLGGAHFNIAQCLRLEGKPDKAIVEYKKYLEVLPDSPFRAEVEGNITALETAMPTPSVEEAKEHFDKGQALFEAGKYKEAIEEYGTAITYCPPESKETLAHIEFNVGQCFRMSGDPENAIAAYSGMLTLDPKTPYAEEVKDKIRELQKSLPPPEPSLEKAKEHFDTADALYKEGNFFEAEMEYRRASAWVPPDEADQHAGISFDIAQCLRLQGKKEEAVEEYQHYLKLAPDSPYLEEIKDKIMELGGAVPSDQQSTPAGEVTPGSQSLG